MYNPSIHNRMLNPMIVMDLNWPEQELWYPYRIQDSDQLRVGEKYLSTWISFYNECNNRALHGPKQDIKEDYSCLMRIQLHSCCLQIWNWISLACGLKKNRMVHILISNHVTASLQVFVRCKHRSFLRKSSQLCKLFKYKKWYTGYCEVCPNSLVA